MRLSLRMRRLLSWMIGLLLGTGLAFILVLAITLWSPGMARYLMRMADAQLEALELEGVSGSLARGIHADRLTWRDGDLTLSADSLAVRVDWLCLIRGELCLDRLQAARFTIQDASPPKPDWQGLSLPAFSVPVPLVFRQLTVETLVLDAPGAHQNNLGRFEGRGRLEGSLLRVGRLAWQSRGSLAGDADLEATGDLFFQSPFRTSLSLSGQWHPPNIHLPWRAMHLSLTGPLTRLEARLVTENGLEATAVADVTHPRLPLRLSASLSRRMPELPWLAIPARLSAQGTLLGTLMSTASAGLSLDGYPELRLQADAAVTLEALTNATIQVSDGEGTLTYSGSVSWRDALSAQGELHARDLDLTPWHPALPVQLSGRTRLALQARGSGWDVSAHRLNIAGHYGDRPFSLAGDGAWLTDHLESPELTLTIAGQTLTFAGQAGTALDARVMLDAPHIDALIPQLSGDLSAKLSLSGTLATPRFDLTTTSNALSTQGMRIRDSQLRLSGTPEAHTWEIRTHRDVTRFNAHGTGHVSRDQLQWTAEVNALSLGHADDDVQLERPASLVLSRSEAGLTQVALSHACLASGINRICLSGALDPPAGQFHAMLDTLSLQLDGLHAWQALAGLPVRLGGVLAGRLNLSGQMSRPRIQGELDWTNGQILAQDGRPLLTALEANWRGDSESGHLTFAATDGLNNRWQTATPSEYQLADTRMALKPTCVVSQDTSLCVQGVAGPDTVDLTLTGTSELQSLLAPHLPSHTRVSGPASLHLKVARRPGRPATAEGELRLDAPVVETDIPDAPPLILRFDAIGLTAKADPEQIETHLNVSGPYLGHARVQARIPRKRLDQPTVRFDIEQLSLSTFMPLLSATRTLVEGELNARGHWTGGWRNPLVEAEINLTEGQLSGPRIPIPLEDLNLKSTVNGQRVRLEGLARSGNGQLRLTGQGRVGPDWQANLQLTGETIPLSAPPVLAGTGTPDIRVQAARDAIRIDGSLRIDRADIRLEGGTSRVDPSSDIRVVRTERPEPAAGHAFPPVTLNLRLDVPDSVQAQGYGADLKIGGRLEIVWSDRQSLTGQGLLQIREGRYEAYGQRLKIRSGQVQFNGPLRRPWLRIEAVREVDTTVVGLRIEGPPERLRATPFSEPSMPEDHVLYYLITGRPPGGQSTDERQLVNRAMLSLALTGSLPVAQTLAEKLNISDFRVGTQGEGDQTTVQVSGYVSPRLYLEYGFGVFEPVNTLLTRYRLRENVYLEAVSGIEQILTLLWSKEF
ncbi:MAG: hypothetical protein D6758_12080 [Gammaproteobacteria bacterium]|nr:MAG: hypothetical protein D6758_12080 [Gammaproteobacteria bacterium]